MGLDRIAAADDLFEVAVQSTFTAGTENVELVAAQAGYTLRLVEAYLIARTNVAGANSTITFKRGTTALRQLPTVDGYERYLPPRPRGWCETTLDTEALQVNASVALTSLSGLVVVQRIPLAA